MFLIAWIFIGVVVGWGVGRDHQGNGFGPFKDVVLGIGGAVVGGWWIGSAGYGGPIITSLFAVIGALLLTILVGLVDGRRIYAHQRW